MSGARVSDRRATRKAATRREILDSAWGAVREDGLASLTMRELGARVGMRAQSLYGYFPSKHAIYDAMFFDANQELLDQMLALPALDDAAEMLRARSRLFLQFAVEDPVRYQLLFQRTIPGFKPSQAAYAPAVEVLENGRAALRACGITSVRSLDVYTAVIAGLAAQQNSNEPGGDRWVRLVDEVTDMYLAHQRSGQGAGHDQ